MDIIKAAKLMVQSKQNRVPVIKSTTDRTVIGFLSSVDILRNVEVPKKCSQNAKGRNDKKKSKPVYQKIKSAQSGGAYARD